MEVPQSHHVIIDLLHSTLGFGEPDSLKYVWNSAHHNTIQVTLHGNHTSIFVSLCRLSITFSVFISY